MPLDFQEDVKLAQNRGERGDLRLLAEEVQGFEWESEGLRLIGEAQFRLKAFPGAKETFETLRKAAPGDVRANLRLGTIYQKLAGKASAADKEAFLTRSDQAIRRALDVAAAPADRAEAFSLLGSNAKTRWLDDWRDVAAPTRSSAALRSAHLADALEAYLNAYAADLTGYYPGVNALAMLKVQSGLALRAPEAWEAAAREGDFVFEGQDGAKVFIDPKSHRLIDGTTLDYDTSLVSRGFIFSNPNAKSTCGCGTSFSV